MSDLIRLQSRIFLWWDPQQRPLVSGLGALTLGSEGGEVLRSGLLGLRERDLRPELLCQRKKRAEGPEYWGLREELRSAVLLGLKEEGLGTWTPGS